MPNLPIDKVRSPLRAAFEQAFPSANAGMNGVYRERAALVAYLATLHSSTVRFDTHTDPSWMLIFFELANGQQVSWHISENDRDLFQGLLDLPDREVEGDEHWDRHTTEEKYERMFQASHSLTKGLKA